MPEIAAVCFSSFSSIPPCSSSLFFRKLPLFPSRSSIQFVRKASGSAGFLGDDALGPYPWESSYSDDHSVQWVQEEKITLFTADGLIQIGGNIVKRKMSSFDKKQGKLKVSPRLQRFRESSYMDPNQSLCLGALFDIAATNGLDMGRKLCIIGFCRSIEMLSDVVEDTVLEHGGEVPTIDFCKPELKPGTVQWDFTKFQVLQALQEYGCFEAIYDKLPNEIRQAMFSCSKEFFYFPLETKQKNFSKKPFSGYLGQLPTQPLYESVCIDDLLQPGSVETVATIFWPDRNPDFCNVVKSYSKPLVELDEMVKRMVLESLGLRNYIDEFLDLNSFVL